MKTRYSVLLIIAVFSFFSLSAQVTLPVRQLDTTLMVGATPGNANVSGGGAATYSLPIFVSPGTAGLQPNISIEYNSQSPNGVLGAGWNIAGVSAITRAPKDYYHDGIIKGVDLINDQFEWDGNRITAFSGGSNGTEYASESERFAYIVSPTSGSGTLPISFNIRTKDGMKLAYGETANSRIEVPGTATALLWRLNQMKDINGNYINYSYIEQNGESYIDTISYTGNTTTGQLPYNKVKFIYENRPDTSMYFIGGISIRQTKRLIGIDIFCENIKVRHYTFSYLPINVVNTGYEKSRLSQIQESTIISGSTKSLNPTVINWGTDTQIASVISISTSTATEITQSFFSDLNGDGRTDQFIIGKPALNSYFTHWYYYQSDGNTLTKVSSGNLNLPYCKGAWITDINNDGKNEILIKTGVMTDALEDAAWNYSIIHDSLVRDSTAYDVNLPSEDAKIIAGQFDSDGKTDLIILNPDNNYYGVKGFTVNTNPNFNTPDKIEKMDFDGDGMDEIFVMKNGAYIVYKYNKTSLAFSAITTDTLPSLSSSSMKTGDFNGDGKTDIVLHGGIQTTFSVYLSTGIAFDSPRTTPRDLILNGGTNAEADFYVLDLNGDGRDDILDYYSILASCPPIINEDDGHLLNGSPGFIQYLSKFDGTLGLYSFQKIDDQLTGKDAALNLGDIDGDGMNDATLMVNASHYPVTPNFNGIVYKNFASLQKSRIQTISNGLNQAAGFTYISLAAVGTGKYTKGKTASFPVINVQPAQFVVATFTTHAGYMTNGSYVYSITDYSYKGARSHLQGKGYLGFDTLVSVNNLSNIKNESCYGINNIYYFRYPTAVNSYVANVAASKKTFTFTTLSTGTKRYYSYPLQDISNDLVTNTTVTHDYTFDNAGNMLTDKATFGSDAVITTTNDYIFVGGSYSYKNRINSSIVSSVYTGQPAFSTKKTYTYDTKGNCLSAIDFANQAKPITSTYVINSYGLPTSVTLSATGMTSRTNRTDYDSKYRMPVRSINPFGYKSSRTYDFKFGVALSDSSANGLITYYAYDELGRLKNTTVPQGYIMTQNLAWPKSTDPAGTIYSSTTIVPGKPTVKAYYDILGRGIRSETAGFSNKTLYTDINYVPASPYGKAGMLTSQSLPYYSGETQVPVSYKYDVYGRVTDIVGNSKSTRSVYSGKSVTTTDVSCLTSTTTMNALGNVIAATDDGGSIAYLYHSSGQPRQITAAGAVTTITYDAYGRQLTLTDPDAGTTRYTYNAFGELASKTDANSNTDTLIYDVLGRVTQKTLKSATGSELTTYLYNTSGRAIGQPASITGSNGAKQEFTYDAAYGWPATIVQTIPGQVAKFTTSYTYDIYGNNTKITYPETGFAVTNTFDKGMLVKVSRTSDNSLIWQLNTLSSHGMPVQTSFGNGLSTNYEYDMDLLSQITTGTVQNETYYVNHPNTVRLLGRKDNITGQYENFAYDNLDRLTGITYMTQPVQSITYSGNGNINSKYNGGDYLYDPTKVHAVTSVTKPHGAASQALQDIAYTRFNKASSIIQKTTGPVVKTLYYGITYGPDEQRVKTINTDSNNVITTRYYAGGYEKDSTNGTCKKIHYITGGTGLVAVYIKWSTGQDSMFYVCTDRQGSITALLKQNGAVSERYSYDAYGRRRNPANWTDYNVKAPRLITRGYTGHEMLDGLGLINMNGRMYDPVIGRVLSPDMVVQNAGNTQSYNRYSYCMNNPLRYTDPSGWYVMLSNGHKVGQDFNDWGVSNSANLYMPGGGSGYSYNSSTGDYMLNGEVVAYWQVQSNYIVPNSITYNGQEAKNFVGLLNMLGQYTVGVNGNQVIVNYIPSSDLLASNGSSCPPSSPLLRTGTQFFSGTLGALTIEGDHEGKEGPGAGMSGAYYRGFIRLDAIYDLSTKSQVGYDLTISASFASSTEDRLSGKIDIFRNEYTTTFILSPSRSATNLEGYTEIGRLSLTMPTNTSYLHVEINISLILNGGTFNKRTHDTYGFDF